MYDVKSPRAEEFINHDEVLETLAYAESNKHNAELIDKHHRQGQAGQAPEPS